MYNIKIKYIDNTEEEFNNLEDYSYDGDVSLTLNVDVSHQIDVMIHQIRTVYIEEIQTDNEETESRF